MAICNKRGLLNWRQNHYTDWSSNNGSWLGNMFHMCQQYQYYIIVVDLKQIRMKIIGTTDKSMNKGYILTLNITVWHKHFTLVKYRRLSQCIQVIYQFSNFKLWLLSFAGKKTLPWIQKRNHDYIYIHMQFHFQVKEKK